MIDIDYSINEVNFKDYGVYVSGSEGITDGLKMKDPMSFDWGGYHGKAIDLSAPRFETRKISLECFIQTSGRAAFIDAVKLFLSQFSTPGTKRLKIAVVAAKPLVYEVYCPDATAISKDGWDETLMVGTFTLKLEEPEPIKKVLQHTRTGTSTKTASLTISSSKLLNIYWGDGTYTFDVSGTNVTITHDYATNKSYEIIVTGVIEEISAFTINTTNTTVLWTKL